MHRLNHDDFVPAGGQGALAIEALAQRTIADSAEIERAVSALDDLRARLEVSAERAFLAEIGASCASPIGVKAIAEDGRLIDLRVAIQSRRRALDDRAACKLHSPQISPQPRRLASNWRGGCWRAARGN